MRYNKEIGFLKNLNRHSFNSKDFKDIRIEINMTQKEFADLIGISSTIVSQLENEKTCPNFTTIKKIKKLIDYLKEKGNKHE